MTELPPIESDLTEKQKHFCEEYVKDFNGTEACLRAGYGKGDPGSQAYQLLQNPRVSAYIKEIQKRMWWKLNITQERVLNGFAEIAFDPKAKPSDRKGALDSLARHLGMFNDKMNLTADGFVINIHK